MDPPEQKAGTPIDQQDQALRTPPKASRRLYVIYTRFRVVGIVDFLGGLGQRDVWEQRMFAHYRLREGKSAASWSKAS